MDASELKSLVARLGGPSKVAELLTTGARPLTQPAVSNWIARGSVPPIHCTALALLAGLTPNDIRPDVFGPAPSEQPKQAPKRKRAA